MGRRVIFLGLAGEAKTFSESAGRRRADEIWTVNDWYQRIPRVRTPDRVFNIHADITNHATDLNRFTGDTIKEYNESGAEIVTSRYFPELDNCRPFDLLKLIDIRRDPFFSSTLAVMFVMAWLECWEEIELVGVVLGHDTEFDVQVPAVVGAIHESERRGIQVIAPHREAWAKRGVVVAPWKNNGCPHAPYWMEQYQLSDAPGVTKASADRPLPYKIFEKV